MSATGRLSPALFVAVAVVGCASLTGEGPEPTAVATGTTAGIGQSVARGVTLPAYRRLTLDNGLVLLLLEKHDVPLVGFELAIRGGSVADAPGKAGTASLLGALLEKGAGQRDARQFAEAVAAVGGRLGAGAGMESISISGEFMARDQALMVELLTDMLARPALDPAEFSKVRERSIELIRAARDSDPRALIGTYGGAFLFAGHPYGRPVGGSETTLANVGLEEVKRFYREHVGADRMILAVAGDFDSAAMEQRLRAAFATLRRSDGPLPAVDDPEPVTGTRVLLVDKPDATQSYFWLGNVGVARQFERRAELNLANTVFGGRFTSMLNTELRIKSGLSYGASARISRPTRAGSLAIVSFTATETTNRAIDVALATLDRLHADGLDEAALASAKSYVLGQYPLGFEVARQLAGQMLALEFYRLERSWIDGYAEKIAAASPESVRATIASVYPQKTNLVFVVIGAADAIRDELAAFGPVTEIAITEPTFAF